MRIQAEPLRRLVGAVFEAAGCAPVEAERIAHYLVESNLVGHDSHGVIRVRDYVRWIDEGRVFVNQRPEVVFENASAAILDGNFGFGQVMGEHAIRLGIEKSLSSGVAVIALRNSGHLGRIGDWAEMSARANRVSLHFVNTSGIGILVAPTGGIDRRLSANPIAAGIPVAGLDPIVLDISTASIAEGKIKVARNKGVRVPDGVIIDSHGRPTNEPEVFYADPPGAILPIGGHKGYGLSILVEALAGALTGGGCSRAGVTRFGQGMLSILFEPRVFQAGDSFFAEVRRFIDFIKTSRKASPDGEILAPGEIEARTRVLRLAQGVDLDDTTWRQLVETAESKGLRAQDYVEPSAPEI